MHVIVSLIAGFLSAQFPVLLEMLQARFSHQREIEALNAGLTQVAQTNAELAKAIDTLRTQEPECLACLKASVRPVVTYIFVLLFAVVTLESLWYGFETRVALGQLLPLVWNDNTVDLFSVIVGAWFGSRGKEKSTASRREPLQGTQQVSDGM